MPINPAQQVKKRLQEGDILVMAGCYDALSAQLAEKADFEATFMSGFAVSASRLGEPDTGLLSYGEILDQGRNICQAVSIPVFGDGDTGYGNAMNVKRTVREYAQAGFACIMIEDQVAPKRCGHTKGKLVVDRQEAFSRIQAAVDAREEGADILIMARTDARATHDLDEAIYRAQIFAEIGADITFLEAPQTEAEMQRYCDEVSGIKMANLIAQGKTPVLPPVQLQKMGYSIAVYPLTTLSAAIQAMQNALLDLKQGRTPQGICFDELKTCVGFDNYYAEEARYAVKLVEK